nr:hypothetical protein [Candidatus Omnitrophota bacterium]
MKGIKNIFEGRWGIIGVGIIIGILPKSTTNFQQILEGREFADNLHSPHYTKRIIVYAVKSIIIKC